jgi:hypothetical protein
MRIAGLHTQERLEELMQTCQMDYRRAVDVWRRRYGGVRTFAYDGIGDAVSHFYNEVLAVDPPAEHPGRPNVGLPAVTVDLARQYTIANGRMDWFQVKSIANLGNREKVDLLGPANRRRVREYFEAQNADLGALVGREVFFDDLTAIEAIEPDAITPDEANERYRDIFEALTVLPSIHEVRRECLALEAEGCDAAAADLFSLHAPRFSPDELAWFDRDLRAATSGRWWLVDGRYETEPDPSPSPGFDPMILRCRRLAGAGRRRAQRARRALRRRLPGS